nr:hypothetical protein [Tanacetum cinerariifolium]
MAAVELPQTLEYRGGQLNVASVLEVEDFTNWKKRFICQILGIEPQFENIIKNGPFIPMTAGQSKPEGQWSGDERKAANLDRRLKSLIMSVLPDDQMNSVINYLTAKSTSNDLILYHDGLSDVKESRVMDLKLCYNTFKFKEEEVSSDNNEMVEVKVLMALAEENDAISKEGARNGEWVKNSMRKVHTFLEMKDNDDRKTYLDYLCIDLNYVEEQRNNLLSKHRYLVHELITCKEHLLVLKQAKLNFLTMQHVNTEILKENKSLRIELKELTAITETWLNSSNKVNQCISEQIPSQKKRILRVDQLTEDPSSYGQKDIVFVKSSANDIKVILPSKSQRNTTDPLVAVVDSSATEYDSTNKSSVCSTPLSPLKKLDGAEPVSGLKTIKSILKSKFTFKAKNLKCVTINEPFSALAKGNKSSSALKVNSALTGGKTGGPDQISNKDATILYCLANAVKVDYAKLIWEDIIHKLNKKTSENVVPYPRFISLLQEYMMPEYDNEELTLNPTQVFCVHNWALKPNQIEGPPFTKHMKAICNLDVSVDSKALKPSSQTEEVPQGKKPGAKNESEEEANKDKDTHATSHDDELKQQKAKAKAEITLLKSRPSYPDINQLTDLLVSSLKPEFLKLLASHDFASCLPTKLKELPSKFTELSREIKELKNHVTNIEIELHGDLKEIPTKLENFTSTIFSLTSQEKLKTLDSLLSLLNKVADTLNRFSTVVENASGATCNNVPSAGKATASPTRGKNTNPDTTDDEPNLHDELVDLLGIYVVTQYYNKKLFYDKYYDKMLKRRKCSKITNSNVLTQKGPISLTIHREDGTSEVISNIKVSNLHLAEWREVVQACPDRKEKGWKIIYELIKIRIKYLDQTKKELKIDFKKPLKEQDPLNELNDLANKKRKRTVQNAGNPAGYNDVIENQVNQNAVQNLRIQNVGNQNGLIGVQGNSNLVAAHAEENAAGQNENQIRCYNCRGVAAADLDEIEEVNANCILMANL